MKHYNKLLYFVLHFICIYFAFVALLFMGLGDEYSSYFRDYGNFFFGTHWENVAISFVLKNVQQTTLADGHRATNISVRINNKNYHYTDGRPVLGELGANSHLQGYLPTSMFLALMLATPIGWKHRLKSLGIGLLFIHVFIAAVLWLIIVGYTEANGIGIYRFGDTVKGIISWMMQITLINQIGISFIVPMVIWIFIISLVGEFRAFFPLRNKV
ncbi:MAG: hypothetical protein JST20_04960 [Bacteroidetes bacterium]|nr:hypothetical protein [Bacteroidota bacterium]